MRVYSYIEVEELLGHDCDCDWLYPFADEADLFGKTQRTENRQIYGCGSPPVSADHVSVESEQQGQNKNIMTEKKEQTSPLGHQLA